MRRRLAALLVGMTACWGSRWQVPAEPVAPDAVDGDPVVVAPVDPCLVAPPRVTAGTGLTAFRPLVDGEVVHGVRGAQVGWHVDGAVRVVGASPDVRVRFEVEDEATGQPLHASEVAVRLRPTGEAWACEGTHAGLMGHLTLPPALLPSPACDPEGAPAEMAPGVPCPTLPEVLCDRTLRLRYVVRAPDGALVGSAEGTARFATDPAEGLPCPPG